MPVLIAYLALWAVLLLLLGCGSAGHDDPASSSLVAGVRAAPTPRAQLATAARLAHRFALAYGRAAYMRVPPPLPGATAAVERKIARTALRVPPSRRHLHPRAGDLRLAVLGADRLEASLTVVDGSSPAFSVAFLVRRRGSSWRVVSIATPE